MKRLIIFDLDGTLAESKRPISPHMAELLFKLLEKAKVGIISGASYSQLAGQFVRHIHADAKHLKNLYLLPVNGTALYSYEDGWKKEYEHLLVQREIAEIISAIEYALRESGVDIPKLIFGQRIESRGSQVTFSAAGQGAPIAAKRDWDPDQVKRQKIKKILDASLPTFSVSIGGMTSIDITKKGFDKHFGIDELVKKLKLPKESILFIGDAIFPGGNDYSAVEAGVDTQPVKNPKETEDWIENFLK